MLAWYPDPHDYCATTALATLAMGLTAVDFTMLLASSSGAHGYDVGGPWGCRQLRRTYYCARRISCARSCSARRASRPRASPTRSPSGIQWECCVLTLYQDRRRIRIPHVLAAGVPYVAGAVGWGLYIMQAPHDFTLQFGGNAAGRSTPLSDPMACCTASSSNATGTCSAWRRIRAG